MDIMELGAIGELVGGIGSAVGGIAVLATLAYLAIQVRQSNRLAQASAIQTYVHTFNRDVFSPLRDLAFAKLVHRGLNDFRSLERDEQIALDAQMGKIILLGQTEFFLRRHGLIQEEFGQSRQAVDVALLKSRGGAQWWGAVRHAYPAEYVAHLDRLVAEENFPAMTEFFPWYAPDDNGQQED